MNQLRVLIFFAVVWIAVSASSMSTASAQCVANLAGGPMDKDENGNQVYKIYLYFEADIHQEIAAISPETADDSLTRTQVVQTAMTAAEIWNQQTRGMALVYGGIVNDDTRGEFCAAPPTKRPAIFVHLNEDITDCGAWFDDGSDWCSGRAVSEVYLRNGGHCGSTGSVISEGWPIVTTRVNHGAVLPFVPESKRSFPEHFSRSV